MDKMADQSQRWKTAAVLLGIVGLVGIIDSHFVTWLFFGIVYMAAFYEAMKLFEYEENSLYIYAAILWVAAGFWPHPSDLLFAVLIILASQLAYKRTLNVRSFLPFLYPTAGMLFIWMLYLSYGMQSMVWILVIVALTDVGAYYTGKSIGKTPFSPTSPNKTLEGVMGGVAAGSILGAIVLASSSKAGFFAALIIAVITSVASVFGDLFESYLKREAGVKDSGTLLPGHGGALDRIDGYLFASVALYILLSFFGA